MIAHRPPETVGLAAAEPGAVHRDLEDLLLVEDDAQGLLEDRFQARVDLHHRLLTLLAPQVWMYPIALGRSGADDGGLEDEILERPRARPRQCRDLRPALDLEGAGTVRVRAPGLVPLGFLL